MTRQTGERVRTPKKFFGDEVQTNNATEASSAHGDHTRTVGANKRYASINVRTLAMKGNKNRKEACGQTAAAVEWVLEFEDRGLGIVYRTGWMSAEGTIGHSIREMRMASGNTGWAYACITVSQEENSTSNP